MYKLQESCVNLTNDRVASSGGWNRSPGVWRRIPSCPRRLESPAAETSTVDCKGNRYFLKLMVCSQVTSAFVSNVKNGACEYIVMTSNGVSWNRYRYLSQIRPA